MESNKEEMDKNLKLSEEEVSVDSIKEEKSESKIVYGIKLLLSGVIDQIAAMAGAFILFLLLTLILKVVGYKIVEKQEMFLIVFIISNVLYYPLVQEFLKGKTFGRKLVLK